MVFWISGGIQVCGAHLSRYSDNQVVILKATFPILVNVKRTWVDYGVGRDWTDDKQGRGEEFLYHSTQVKNVWLTMGDIFAN